jgi:hypothetical protein
LIGRIPTAASKYEQKPNFLQQEFFRNFSNKRSNRARSDILDDADHGNRTYLTVQEKLYKILKKIANRHSGRARFDDFHGTDPGNRT